MLACVLLFVLRIRACAHVCTCVCTCAFVKIKMIWTMDCNDINIIFVRAEKNAKIIKVAAQLVLPSQRRQKREKRKTYRENREIATSETRKTYEKYKNV